MLLYAVTDLQFESMISKNIKKSSQFLIIAPEYMKVRESKQTNIHKSNLMSPKQTLNTPRMQLKQKTKAIDALARHSQKLIEKVKSLSPRTKQQTDQPINNSRRNDSKTKSKSKKDTSFEKWRNDFFRSFHEEKRSIAKSNHQKELFKREESSRNNEESHFPDTKQYHKVLQRTKQLFRKYGDRIKEIRDINRALVLENCQLKTKLNRYQRI